MSSVEQQAWREAADPTTPPARLRELAASAASDARGGGAAGARAALLPRVASNPNAPADLVLSLSDRFPEEALANPAWGLWLLEEPALLAGAPLAALIALCASPAAPPPLLRAALAARDEEPLLTAIARNRAAPVDVLGACAAHALRGVREAAALNPASPRALVELLVRAGSTPSLADPRPDEGQRGDGVASGEAQRQGALSGEDASALLAAGPYGRLLLGRRRDAAPEALARLAAALGEAEVREAVARNERTPAGSLAALAADGHPYVLAALAANPAAPPDALASLAGSLAPGVRIGLAGNPSTPAPVLAALAASMDEEVRRAASSNPSTDPARTALLRRAGAGDDLADGDAAGPLSAADIEALRAAGAFGRLLLARQVALPDEVLTTLASDREPRVRAAAGRHPALPLAALEVLCDDDDRMVRVAVAGRAVIPPGIALRLLDDARLEVRHALAANPASPDEALFALAARAPTLPAVAMNPRAPASLLATLAAGDAGSRRLVAASPAAPPRLLAALAADGDRDVRKAVAENAATPLTLLAPLARDPDAAVRTAAARRPELPPALLAALAGDDAPAVRFLVAVHPGTPGQALRRLSLDADHRVAQAAELSRWRRQGGPT
jgi:hypothetical protein